MVFVIVHGSLQLNHCMDPLAIALAPEKIPGFFEKPGI
jgi:hypothetical protein